MATATQIPATLDDLLKVREKAELIGGRIVYFMASDEYHGTVALEITVSLREHAAATRRGKAYGDNVGFALAAPLPSGRLSFSPDAAYNAVRSATKNRRFVPGAPSFAVEVRSEGDYGPKAEREIADKRADYFAAGTLAVWDVDPDAETITLYTPADPINPTIFLRGSVAHAEPAVPGWRLNVGDLFDAAAN